MKSTNLKNMVYEQGLQLDISRGTQKIQTDSLKLSSTKTSMHAWQLYLWASKTVYDKQYMLQFKFYLL